MGSVVKHFKLDFVLLAELFGQVKVFLLSRIFLADTNFLNIFLKLNGTMDLNLLIGGNNSRRGRFTLNCFKSSFKFIVIKLIQNMNAVMKSTNNGVFNAGISIGECTPAANVRLDNKIGLTVAFACINTLDILGKIDSTVLDTFRFLSTVIFLFEKPSLPPGSHLQIIRTRGMTSFELISVVSVLSEEFHVFVDMDVDDDRNFVHDVICDFNKIVLIFTHLFDSLKEEVFVDLVQSGGFFVHVEDCGILGLA